MYSCKHLRKKLRITGKIFGDFKEKPYICRNFPSLTLLRDDKKDFSLYYQLKTYRLCNNQKQVAKPISSVS